MKVEDVYRELNLLRRDFGNRIGELLDRLTAAERAGDPDQPVTDGLRRSTRPGAWTSEQDQLLAKLWADPSNSIAAIAAALPPPERSPGAVTFRIYNVLRLPARGAYRGGPRRLEGKSGAPGRAVAAPPRPVDRRDPSDGPRPSTMAVDARPLPAAPEPRPQPVTAHIPAAEFDENEPVSIQTVLTFLRRRGFTVAQSSSCQFVLDGRRTVNTDTLLEVANRHRKTVKQPPFRLIGAA